jgi:hypothetical protein
VIDKFPPRESMAETLPRYLSSLVAFLALAGRLWRAGDDAGLLVGAFSALNPARQKLNNNKETKSNPDSLFIICAFPVIDDAYSVS